jgi:hypothetical protein
MPVGVLHRYWYPVREAPVTVAGMAFDRVRTARGALAGAVAAGVWALQEPLDDLVFKTGYSDVALLGGAVGAGRGAGLAVHLVNGAAFGAVYAEFAPRLGASLPASARGPAAAMAEHLASWPLTAFSSAVPATPRGFAQATWRHALFGVVLGELERRLNDAGDEDDDAYHAMVSSNGHGNIEHAIIGAEG